MSEIIEKNHRNLNVETLRCLLMYLVILDHCFAHGIFQNHRTSLWSLPFSLLLFWHVPAFVSISGYYGIKFTFKRFLSIYGIVVFYSALSMTVKFISCGAIGIRDVRIEAGWFGGAYLCLLLIAPFLNAAINSLIAESKKKLIIIWSGLAVVMVLNWLPRQMMTGISAQGIGPFTLALMMFIYISSRVFSLVVKDFFKITHFMLVAGVFVVATLVFYNFELTDKCLYNSPLVISMAIATVALFDRYIHLPKFVCSISNWIGPSIFGVYLCHATTCFGIDYMRVLERWIGSICGCMHMTILLSSLVVFIVCIVIDLMRRGVLYGVRHAIKRA